MRSRSLLILSVLAVSGAAWSPPAVAQDSLPHLESIEITEPLHASLALLQEYWLEWLTAYHERDRERAAAVVSDIVETMDELGVRRLSDLSFGAVASAVQAARASDFERAAWSLEAAERLDPRRPEIAFAAATIARLEGRRMAAIRHQSEGYLRLLSFPWERAILGQDLILWLLFILTLSAALFVVLLASTRGEAFRADLAALLSRRLPETAARIASVVLLLWPLVLPNGVFWLLVFWTVAFWGYSSRSERAMLAVAWLLLGVVPGIVSLQRRHMAVTLSSPTRVMENLALSRLEGSTLTDLAELRTLLPDSVAVKQLLADVHRRLGQWEFARALYLDVIDAEPHNAEAMINLGAFYFHVGDYASAIQHFQRASAKDALAAVANFNLSQAYSASYLFTQSEQALRAAQQLDAAGVSRWIDRSATERIITIDGGIQRREAIDRQLRAAWNPAERPPSLLARLAGSGSMRLALVVAALAVALEALARRFGFYASPRALPAVRSDDAEGRPVSLAVVLIPGVETVRRADGYRTVAALLVPVALLTLPLVTLLGYRVPWGYDPGSFLAWAIAGFGLLAYVARRVLRGLRA